MRTLGTLPTRSCFYYGERFTYEPRKHDWKSALAESLVDREHIVNNDENTVITVHVWLHVSIVLKTCFDTCL
jgi:hypothetical protein